MERRDFLAFSAAIGGAFLFGSSTTQAAEQTLEPLPYAFDALEPHIDATTMQIHHGRHHKTYVDNLNAALAKLPDWKDKPLETILTQTDKLPAEAKNPIINNGGGHWNHTLFWKTMTKGGSKPKGELAKKIDTDWKSLDALQAEFKKMALSHFGSGWVWLLYNKTKNTLEFKTTANQSNPVIEGTGLPLVGIDLWEHAYYLKYQNKRADYVDAWFKVAHWDVVSDIFAKLARG